MSISVQTIMCWQFKVNPDENDEKLYIDTPGWHGGREEKYGCIGTHT